MAWGAPRGVDDLIQKLTKNKTAKTMCVLSTRKFGCADAVAFASALTRNTSLSELLASGHTLGPEEASAFGRALAINTTLRYLCLGDKEFGDEGVGALVENGLTSNMGLVVLDLEYKSITSGKALCSLLQKHPTLEDLRLGRNQLAAAGATAIFEGLSRNSTLTSLDLSGNFLDASAATALDRALSFRRECTYPATTASASDADRQTSSASIDSNIGVFCSTPSLRHLDISRNPLGDEGGATLFHALASVSSLRSLRVAEAGIGYKAAIALAEALVPVMSKNATPITVPSPTAPSGTQLQDVVTANEDTLANNANVRGSHAFTANVKSERRLTTEPTGGLPQLETLDVSKNNFGIAGAQQLAKALARGGGPQLESLSIGYNKVGDAGAVEIGRAATNGLRSLDLSGNALSDLGLAAIVSARGLREAKLFHNSCGDAGIPLVLEALIAGGHVETLDLGANGLTGAGLEALLPGLAECSSLHTLEVGANSTDDRAAAAVQRSMANNPRLDIAFKRGGAAMEGSGAPPDVARSMRGCSRLEPSD